MSRYRKTQDGAFDPFSQPEDVDAAIFSGGAKASELGDPGKVVARSTPLDGVWADVAQPRRAIPASIRLHWNGSPELVPEMLNQWYMAATRLVKRDIDAAQIVQGGGEGLEAENWPPLAQEYVELLRLAASIRADGLINPISIVREGNRHVVVAGERRMLAYHALAIFDDAGGKWDKIPAIEVKDRRHVWLQAAENTARRQLNAISMARQLALLIMAARTEAGEGGSYKSYEDLARPGWCDRRFYAQVADGNTHRIPKGFAERIQAAMGLSGSQLSHYRRLLRLTEDDEINDAFWVKADVEDWPERWLRDVATFTAVKVREVIRKDEWHYFDLMTEKTGVFGSEAPPELIAGAPVPGAIPRPVERTPTPADWSTHAPGETPRITRHPAFDPTVKPGWAVGIKATGEIAVVMEADGQWLSLRGSGGLLRVGWGDVWVPDVQPWATYQAQRMAEKTEYGAGVDKGEDAAWGIDEASDNGFSVPFFDDPTRHELSRIAEISAAEMAEQWDSIADYLESAAEYLRRWATDNV